jgi:26S proteasome regulatory subunit (ATPase 3-interacting protein)
MFFSHNSQITKVLIDLTAEGVIEEKVYGKQKIYSAVQPESQTDPEELKKLTQQIKQFEEQATSISAEAASHSKQLSAVLATPTTADAKAALAQLKEANVASEQKLAELTANAGSVSTEDREKILKE